MDLTVEEKLHTGRSLNGELEDRRRSHPRRCYTPMAMALKNPSRKQARSIRRDRTSGRSPDRSFWNGIIDLGRELPRSEWRKIPRDAARNFDHYLDGSPRQN